VTDELAFNGQLLVVQTQVVLQLTVIRYDDALPERVELRSARTSHHLEHVLRTQFHPFALLGTIDLRAFYYDCVRWQIHTPG
jgi:hypothetical protein